MSRSSYRSRRRRADCADHPHHGRNNGDLAIRREAVTIAGTDIAPGIALLRCRSSAANSVTTPSPQRCSSHRSAGIWCSPRPSWRQSLGSFWLQWPPSQHSAGAAVTGSARLLGATHIAELAGTTVVLCMLFGIAGVGIGTPIRNPTTALIVAMSALYLVDPLLGLAIPGRRCPKAQAKSWA